MHSAPALLTPFSFPRLSTGLLLRHHSADSHANHLHPVLCRMRTKGLLLSIDCFSVPDFALPTSWCAVSVGHGGHGIRTCIFSANRLCCPTYTWANLHNWDVRSALDPVTAVPIEIRATAGISSSFADRVKRAVVRKKTSMHARRRIRPLA